MNIKKVTAIAVVAALSFSACSTDEEPETKDDAEETTDTADSEVTEETKSAEANIAGLGENEEVAGTATFTQDEDGKVTMNVAMTGLSEGDHGFHLHTNPSCEDAEDGTVGGGAGGHWNPNEKAHGEPNAEESHAGDTGNITAAADGTATLEVSLDAWTLGDGVEESDVIGHSIITHADADDFTGDSGNAGARIACGVIELAN